MTENLPFWNLEYSNIDINMIIWNYNSNTIIWNKIHVFKHILRKKY